VVKLSKHAPGPWLAAPKRPAPWWGGANRPGRL